MNTLQSVKPLLAGMFLAWALPGAGADSLTTLWQIGTPDDRTTEFALAPGGYTDYRAPAFFVVGVSDPKTDWPYVQPGPVDGAWAPGTPQTFEIVFGLEAGPEGPARLVLDLADTHSSSPPTLRVEVNRHATEHATPQGAGDASIFGDQAAGREHVITVDVPAGTLVAGENRVAISTIRGSWVLWDALRLETAEAARLAAVAPRTMIRSLRSEPALLRHEGREVQSVVVEVDHIGASVQAELRVDGEGVGVELRPGRQQLTAYRTPVVERQTARVELAVAGRTLGTGTMDLEPVRRWVIHVIPQTHLDIGYTHTQEDVLALQVQQLKDAMEIVDASRGQSSDTLFRWHPEGMWAVDEFMRTATKEEQARFIQYCRDQEIHLDVLYAQAMTGMYTDEELFELMASAKRFEREHGVPIDSAMQTDVPGYSWGLCAALAANGVPYLSLGPNAGHRVGHTYHWGDRPFYWEAPNGRDKVLFWLAGRGYSLFLRSGVAQYHGLEDNQLLKYMGDVFNYLRELEEKGYPYDMVMLRYSIGSDNGPPDPTLAPAIADWNRRYVSPRFVIDSNSNFLKTFEARHGDELPVIRGDFTPYWEDGAASTAKATGTNREACERIAQAQILWAMLRPELALHERFDAAWIKLAMYDEHTWGAWNSISHPDDSFAIQQDEYKQAYAFDGARLTRELLRDISAPAAGAEAVDVYNTAAWTRGGLVRLTREQSAAGDRVKDDTGRAVPSQRLASGELAFVAADVPAFGARRYTLHAGQAESGGAAKAEGRRLSNGLLRLEVDAQSGAIQSLRRAGVDADWVDTASAEGINSYLYIIGRNANEGRARVAGPAVVVVEDPGPLVATLRIESDAPGCERLIRQVRLVDGMDHVEIVNTTHKLKERRPEGLYFGFPFNLPGATARVDVPWAVVEVERDQLPGANRNFYCVQRWVDLSNEERGVTWVTVDAPLVQFDPIQLAPAWGLQAWRTYIDPAPFLWSWTMNNHWETNYKADQEGELIFRYALRPHTGGYNAVTAQRFGRDVCQPLLAVTVDPATEAREPLFSLSGSEGLVVTQVRPSRDGKATMVRLFNPADAPQKARLAWNRPVGTTWVSNPMEDRTALAPAELEMGRFEIVTLRVEQ